jgi:c-di-GMP-related signal transduction protein
VKATHWLSTNKTIGLRLILQIHQMLGNKLSLSFKENILRPNLCNQLLGKAKKSIQGSAMTTISGLLSLINFLRANLEGVLAIPLIHSIS